MSAHVTHAAVKNTALYTAATIAQKAISFVYFFVLTRQRVPLEMGGYLWVLSIASLFAIGMDLGLTPLLTREVARHPSRAKAFLEAVFFMKGFLITCTVALLWIVALFVLRVQGEMVLMLAGATLVVMLDACTAVCYATLRGLQNVRVESRAILYFQLTLFAAGMTAAFATSGMLFIMLALVLGSSVNAVYTISRTRKVLGGALWPRYDLATVQHIRGQMPSFAAAGIFNKLYQQADVFLLGVLATTAAVGLYGIPAKVTTALQTLVPGAFAAAIYPTLSFLASHDRPAAHTFFRQVFAVIFLLAVPIAIALMLLTTVLLHLLWPAYSAAALPMIVMLAAIPCLFLVYPTGALLNAAGEERANSTHRGIMTAVSIASNLILIPMIGVMGAAIAFVLANALLLTLDLRRIRGILPILDVDLRRRLIGGVEAGVAMLLVGFASVCLWEFLFPSMLSTSRLVALGSLFVPSLLMSVAYLLALWATKAVTRDDVVQVRALIQKRVSV